MCHAGDRVAAGMQYDQHMHVRVVVPHRGLEAAKTRLASVLSPDERGDLAARLLRRVLRTAHQVVPDVVVISPSADLAILVFAALFLAVGFAAVALQGGRTAPEAKLLSKPFHLKDLVMEVDRIFQTEDQHGRL